MYRYSQIDSQTERIDQKVKVFLWYYINYQQDNWTECLSAAEFQYNNKKYITTEHTLFKLNSVRYLWEGNLTVKIKLLKLEIFLEELWRSWEEAKRVMEIAKEATKKQFDKKKWNLQELKIGENV